MRVGSPSLLSQFAESSMGHSTPDAAKVRSTTCEVAFLARDNSGLPGFAPCEYEGACRYQSGDCPHRIDRLFKQASQRELAE